MTSIEVIDLIKLLDRLFFERIEIPILVIL